MKYDKNTKIKDVILMDGYEEEGFKFPEPLVSELDEQLVRVCRLPVNEVMCFKWFRLLESPVKYGWISKPNKETEEWLVQQFIKNIENLGNSEGCRRKLKKMWV